jgi:hypothetical protein
VIRNITDWDLPEHLDWQWWFVLIHFAAKSNEPVLATMAEDNVLQWAMMARSQGRIDVVCDILENLHEIDFRPQVPFKISQVAKMMQCYACDNEPPSRHYDEVVCGTGAPSTSPLRDGDMKWRCLTTHLSQ